MTKPLTILAIAIFAIVALVHLVRLIYGWDVLIAGVAMPMWASAVGLVVAGGLAAGLWWESRK